MSPNSLRSILVVDDSFHDYETYVRFLSKSPRKFKTQYISLGKELLSKVSESPDCVLLDLSLPDTTGLEILKALKNAHRGALPFPIVMVTGSGDQQTGEQAVQLGAQDYLVKEDVSASSLLRSIEFAMTRFRLEQRLRESEARQRSLAETFGSLVEQSPFGIYTVDSEFRLRNVSAGAMPAFRNLQPAIGRDFGEVMRTLWPEPFASEAIRIFRRTLETGEPYVSPGLTEKRHDTELVESYEWQTSRVTLADGQFGVVCYFFNTTRIQAAMRARLQSEERLRLATEAAGLGIWHWYPEKDVAVWENDRMFEIYGQPLEEGPLSAAEFMERVIHPEDREPFKQGLKEAVETRKRFFFSGRFFRRDGALRWIEFSGQFESATEASGRRMIGTMTDITERKESEEAIRKSEERNRQLAEKMQQAASASELGFWSWDIATGEIDPDQNNRAALGLPVEGPVTFDDFVARIHPDDREEVGTEIEQCLKTGIPYDSEFRVQGGGSSVRWIAARGAVSFDSDGAPLRMDGIAIDITKRKQMAEALRESEERLRLALDAAGMSSWAWTLQDDSISWSANLEPQMAMPPGSFRGGYQAFLDLVHPEDRQRVDTAVNRSIHYGHEYRIEFRMLKADGSIRWTETRGMVRRDPKGNPLQFFGVDLDVTERKHAEQKLEDARANLEIRVTERTRELADALGNLESEVAIRKATEETLRELSARLLRAQDEERRRIARELHDSTGQTLAALKMGIARVQNEIESGMASKESLDESNNLADQAIAEIRTISHLLHPPLLDEVGFNSACKWYVEGFEKRSGIRVSLRIEDIPLSRSASLALFRVLQESLTNVLRHSGATMADVSLTRSGEEVVLVVKDSGKGMPADQIDTFLQTGGGVGIGLAGMRERLKQLGGKLELRSESGTAVISRLPIHADVAENEPDFSAA